MIYIFLSKRFGNMWVIELKICSLDTHIWKMADVLFCLNYSRSTLILYVAMKMLTAMPWQKASGKHWLHFIGKQRKGKDEPCRAMGVILPIFFSPSFLFPINCLIHVIKTLYKVHWSMSSWIWNRQVLRTLPPQFWMSR